MQTDFWPFTLLVSHTLFIKTVEYFTVNENDCNEQMYRHMQKNPSMICRALPKLAAQSSFKSGHSHRKQMFCAINSSQLSLTLSSNKVCWSGTEAGAGPAGPFPYLDAEGPATL